MCSKSWTILLKTANLIEVLNFNGILSSAGPLLALLIVGAIIFSESGLLIGFFLPGDTLLFSAGLLASTGKINIVLLIITTVLAAIIGDNVGYNIGKRTGKKIFTKKDSLLFKQEYIEKASLFYEKHGGKTIILARFTPVVRTFAPVVAGVGEMPRRRFMFYNFVGGALWGISMPLLGYYLGHRFPRIDHYIEYILIFAVVSSVLISALHILKDKRNRQHIVNKTIGRLKRKP